VPAAISNHPVFVLAIIASALVIYRALNFTNFQIPAAIAVVSKGGLEGVVTASAASLLPILAPLVVIAGIVELRAPRVLLSQTYSGKIALWTTVLIGSYLVFVVTPLFVVAVAILSLVVIRWVLADLGGPINPFAAACAITALLSLVALSAWLPPERIVVGSETFTGYVLEESASWTQILRHGGGIILVRNGEVTNRQVCAPVRGLAGTTAGAVVLDILETYAGVKQPAPPPACP